MDVELTIKNYRCFPYDKPARIKIRQGFTSFVGVNNSGKSSLLKFFFELRSLFGTLVTPAHIINSLKSQPLSYNLQAPISDNSEIFCNANDRNIEIQISLSPGEGIQESSASNNLLLTITLIRPSNEFSASLWVNGQKVRGESVSLRETEVLMENTPLGDLLPLLKIFGLFSRMFYVGPFRNILNLAPETSYYDIEVGQSFIARWDIWKNGENTHSNEVAYKVEENIGKIFELPNLQINPSRDGKTLRMFVNGKPYRMDQFGSGLTQFFVILAQAAMSNPSFILIDEPELNLHPSLQLDFLTTLTSYASNGILFATHSIGLARASTNQIYSVRRSSDGLSEIREYDATPRLSEFLGELSFAAYQELGFDKILLVEGATEVKTLQQFLRLYRKDHQIVLLPMGGNQLINGVSETELHEIKRISANIFALIDSERASTDAPLPAERTAFVKACNDVRIACHVLDRRATENYFTDRAVKKIMGNKYSSLTHFERLEDTPFGWAKADNWRIAREMTQEELGNTDLGEFLRSL